MHGTVFRCNSQSTGENSKIVLVIGAIKIIDAVISFRAVVLP